jgi:hypothetical protein
MKIIRSKRKTISLQIKRDGSIEVKAPLYATDAQIQDFLNRKSDWIEKHLQSAKERQEQAEHLTLFTNEEIQKMANQALEVIPERVAHYAPLVGVTYGCITIRNQKSRWGSCSSQGNLNFNCLLMMTPPEVLDSVVVHELCHRKHMNHSKEFYAEIYRVFPEYDKWNKWLKENGSLLIRRMTG